MMRPQPRLIMGSAANHVIRNAPIALIATMRCQPSGSASKNLMRASLCPAAVDMLMPAQLMRISSAPKVPITWSTACRQSAILDTSATALRNFSAKTRFRSEAIETGRIDIDGRNLGAGRCERACHHASHAVRRSGDDGYAARKQLRFCHDAVPPARTMTNRRRRFNRAQFPLHIAPVIAPMLARLRTSPRRERAMWRARLAVAALAIIATFAALESARAEEEL